MAPPNSLTLGPGQPFSGTVATFRDTNTASAANEFTATIAWGDGSTSAGTIGGSSGAFTVSGSHTFRFWFGFKRKITITIGDEGGSSVTAVTTLEYTLF